MPNPSSGIKSKINQWRHNRRKKCDADIEHHGIWVKVMAGGVTLNGQVDSWAEGQEAELIATEVRGVRSVKNELQLSYKSKRSDDEIQKM